MEVVENENKRKRSKGKEKVKEGSIVTPPLKRRKANINKSNRLKKKKNNVRRKLAVVGDTEEGEKEEEEENEEEIDKEEENVLLALTDIYKSLPSPEISCDAPKGLRDSVQMYSYQKVKILFF